jgi:hypothetical protein
VIDRRWDRQLRPRAARRHAGLIVPGLTVILGERVEQPDHVSGEGHARLGYSLPPIAAVEPIAGVALSVSLLGDIVSVSVVGKPSGQTFGDHAGFSSRESALKHRANVLRRRRR